MTEPHRFERLTGPKLVGNFDEISLPIPPGFDGQEVLDFIVGRVFSDHVPFPVEFAFEYCEVIKVLAGE